MLLDCLRPPTNFRIDAAVGTTFTLGLDALLIPPAAWAIHSIGDRLENADPILLANSLRLFAERTVVFHQAGASRPFTPGTEELAAFLDEMVYPIRVGKGETFHPKVWLLRFKNDDGESGLRVLIGSRNLSLESTWDVLVSLDSGLKAEGMASGSQLAAMLRSLPTRTTVALPPGRADLVESLASELDTAFFVAPPESESAEILWWSKGNLPRQLFPQRCERRLVISPFLGTPGLSRLPKPTGDGLSYLVSRASSFDPQLVAGFTPYILRTDLAGLDVGVEARIGSELHAKVFAFDEEERSTVIIGSANATGAAFSVNDEVVVRLRGTRANIGVRALLGEPVEGSDETADFELVDVLEEWFSGEQEEPSAEDFGRYFEEAIRTVASLQLNGECCATDDEKWTITLWLGEPIGGLDGINVDFRLLSRAEPLPAGLALGESVEIIGVDLADITRFVVARFSDPSGVVDAIDTVLVADMQVPPERGCRVLRLLLTNRDKFARFLRYLLDSSQDSTSPIGAGEGDPDSRITTRRRRSGSTIVEEGPILEQLLRLLAARPGDLRQLDAVIKEFAGDEELFPEGFAELWAAISPLIPEEAA